MSFLIHHIDPPAPDAGPAVAALDRGFQLGDGVFDTMLALKGTPFARAEHIDRLMRAAAALGIPAERKAVEDALDQVAGRLEGRDAILRATVTRGEAARGLWPASPGRPTILVTAQPWPSGLVGQPARLVTASVPRNQHSPLSRLKTLSYLDNILAAREAAEAGADDALILNTAGRVACTTIANVVALKHGRLLTPPGSEGCLDGILRGRLLEAAPGLGLAAIETPLTRDDLLAADAVMLTNSVRFLRPVTALDGVALPSSPLLPRLVETVSDGLVRTVAP